VGGMMDKAKREYIEFAKKGEYEVASGVQDSWVHRRDWSYYRNGTFR